MFRHRRPAHAASTVSVHVRNREQLFNSLDPSPFWDRDLDREAAAFIEEEFSDRPRDRPWLLNVPIGDQPDDTQSVLAEAVRRYYQPLTDSVWQQTREQLRIARARCGGASRVTCKSGECAEYVLFPMPAGADFAQWDTM